MSITTSAVGYGMGGTITRRDSYQSIQRKELSKQSTKAVKSAASRQTKANGTLSAAVSDEAMGAIYNSDLQAEWHSQIVPILPNFVEWMRRIGRESLDQIYSLQDALEEENQIAWIR